MEPWSLRNQPFCPRGSLKQAGTLAAVASWVTNSASITDDGANKSVAIPATNTAQFFRLRRP